MDPAGRLRVVEPVAGMGLSVDERKLESLQSALGATVSTTINTASGVFMPYFTAQWMHEFKNDNPSIVAKFVNDPTNYGNQPFVFTTLREDSRQTNIFGTGGPRAFQFAVKFVF